MAALHEGAAWLNTLQTQSVLSQTLLPSVSIGFFGSTLLNQNKMKPTNPNADTYVEGGRQYTLTYLWDTLT